MSGVEPARRQIMDRIASRVFGWQADRQVRSQVGDSYSFAILDVATREVIAEHRATTARLAASSMKLITAVAALRTFPANRTFISAVSGDPQGALYLRGGGDPSMKPNITASLARDTLAALESARTPSSRPLTVFVDEGHFPPPTPAQGWSIDYFPLEVRPVVPLILDQYFGPDPGAAAGRAFAAALTINGQPATFAGLHPTPPDATHLACAESAPVVQQVAHMLQDSYNPVAETLHRQIAIARGFPGTWEGAEAASQQVLADLSLDTDGLKITDGSGLSCSSRLRADTLAQLIITISDRDRYPELAPILYDGALPLAGVTGSISTAHDWFTEPPGSQALGILWAKSGTLAAAVALSGLTFVDDGLPVAFSILVNGTEPDVPQESVRATRRHVEHFATLIHGQGTR